LRIHRIRLFAVFDQMGGPIEFRDLFSITGLSQKGLDSDIAKQLATRKCPGMK